MAFVILSIGFLEPFTWLGKWFLRRGSNFRRARRQAQGKPAPLCDMVWLEGSAVVRILQYLSFLLSGKAPRLKLIWGRSHSSFWHWARDQPAQLSLFRRVIVCAYTLLDSRLFKAFFNSIWLHAGLVDDRRSQADRDDLQKQIDGFAFE